MPESVVAVTGQGGVFPEPSADVEVLALDDPLGPVNLAPQHGVVDRVGLRLGQMRRPNQTAHTEPLYQRVVEADVEP